MRPAAELVAAALEYAAGIARDCSPLTTALTKSVLRADQERGLARSEPQTSRLNRTPEIRAEFREGAAHRRERRPAAFPGLPADHPDVVAWLGP